MKNRKDAMSSMRQILIKRRDALRQALAGDLSMLKEMRSDSRSINAGMWILGQNPQMSYWKLRSLWVAMES